MTNELVAYARTENGVPTGALVAQKDDENTVLIGWSGYKDDDPRPFTKEEALRIARDRIVKGTNKTVPRRMRPMLPDFEDRCRAYFRTDCVIVVGNTVEERDGR